MLNKHEIKTLREAQAILSRTNFTENTFFRNFIYSELRQTHFHMTPLDIAIRFFDAFPEYEEEKEAVCITVREVEGVLYYGKYPCDDLRVTYEYHFSLNVFHTFNSKGVPILHWNIIDEASMGLSGIIIYKCNGDIMHPIGCLVDKIQGYKDLLKVVEEQGRIYMKTNPDLINLFRYFQKVN